MSGPMPSRISKCRLSEASPPVRLKAIKFPQASALAWIFVVNPPRERPRLDFFAPFGTCRRHMRAHDRGIEHLDQTRRWAQRCQHIEERFKHADLLSRSKRSHPLFHFPISFGSARQRKFSTVKKCNACKNLRSSADLRSQRGKQARNTRSVRSQSSSLICVDIIPTP